MTHSRSTFCGALVALLLSLGGVLSCADDDLAEFMANEKALYGKEPLIAVSEFPTAGLPGA